MVALRIVCRTRGSTEILLCELSKDLSWGMTLNCPPGYTYYSMTISMMDDDRIVIKPGSSFGKVPCSGKRIIFQGKQYRVVRIDSYYDHELSYVLTVQKI